VQADVSVAEAVTHLVKTVEGGLGPVAILVNNAGSAWPQVLEEIYFIRVQ
jgi:NAD(P)-dependent dehydrogenase (short-subunit alcohol dehydrogenase family)